MSYKKYKNILYTILAVIIVLAFLQANYLISLIIDINLTFKGVLLICANIILSFVLFYLLYQMAETIQEKDNQIVELKTELEKLKVPVVEDLDENKDTVIFNPENIAQQLIPSSPQNMTPNEFSEKILSNLAKISEISVGIFYSKNNETQQYIPIGKYAYYSNTIIQPVIEGEGLVGQVIKDKKPIIISNIPDNYLQIVSGLGRSVARHVYITPIINSKGDVVGALELASFKAFDNNLIQIIENLTILTGKIIQKIK